MRNDIAKAIKAHVWDILTQNEDLDSEGRTVSQLATWAHYDLLHGPIIKSNDGKPWCGFSKAVERISQALEELGDLWVEDGNILEKEPQPFKDEDGEWIEPVWEEITKVSRKEALRMAFGELAPYL